MHWVDYLDGFEFEKLFVKLNSVALEQRPHDDNRIARFGAFVLDDVIDEEGNILATRVNDMENRTEKDVVRIAGVGEHFAY